MLSIAIRGNSKRSGGRGYLGQYNTFRLDWFRDSKELSARACIELIIIHKKGDENVGKLTHWSLVMFVLGGLYAVIGFTQQAGEASYAARGISLVMLAIGALALLGHKLHRV